ncbi:flagellar basal body-associated FliL family protein [Roseomonas sp. SSH11]|uniref:Flagellar protein FliL n=1 Tax=Pararoseomonas baculiformis TaxID=2820812 RepID=A0ABS4AGU2_9PROT|nr:flagellar basal body-associated FliL family protein [Pararoseomonas baculiformis]MBP0446247.1 flagellar basal body-associated FliL family protein [Pararoseomonas baculiformis]
MAQAAAAEGSQESSAKGGRKKLVLLALPLVAAAVGAGLWFTGLLPFGGPASPAAPHAEAQGTTPSGPGTATPQPSRPPVFFDMPEILTNLNVAGRRATFIRLKAKLELSPDADTAAVQAAMPRLLDLFQTYLREMRPEELRGSQGTYRLREELRNRASLAVSPARVQDILFLELIIQ